MSATIRVLGCVGLLIITVSCTDVGVVTNPSAAPLTTSIAPAPPPDGDPGPQWPTAIHSLTGSLSIPGISEYLPDNDATASATMTYDAYHARLSGQVNITGSAANHWEFFPQETHRFFGFFNQTTSARWNFYLAEQCGNTVELNVLGEVWWMYSGGWSLDQRDRQARTVKNQSECGERVPVSTGGGGGGGGGKPGTGYTCYTYTVDHYWYYPATGHYEYRYTTEVSSWCESNAS